MNEVIVLMYAILIAVFLSGMVIIPLLAFCWRVIKIRMNEIKDGMG